MPDVYPLHEAMAGPSYWDRDQVIDRNGPFYNDGDRSRMALRSLEIEIHNHFAHLRSSQVAAEAVPEGEIPNLETIGSYGLLKVILDIRRVVSNPKHPTTSDIHVHESRIEPDEFDKRAALMDAEPLYDGPAAKLLMTTTAGLAFLLRRTVYMLEAPSRERLAGVDSDALRAGRLWGSVSLNPRDPVGSVAIKGSRRTVITSAQLLRQKPE